MRSAYIRLEFDVPADWKGRVVKLNFDGVQNGAEVYLNGQPVNLDQSSEGKRNFHQGGYNPFQADLTPVVKFGEKNLLAIRVYKNTKAAEMDTRGLFFPRRHPSARDAVLGAKDRPRRSNGPHKSAE